MTFLIVNGILYTLFQNGRRFSVLVFTCKVALVALFLNSKFKRIFPFKRGNKGQFLSKQKNTKIAATLEYVVCDAPKNSRGKHGRISKPCQNTVILAPRYKETRFNEDPVITNIWKPGRITVKYVETNQAITNPVITKSPLYNE